MTGVQTCALPIYHPVIRQAEDAGLLATTELGDRTSYIYRWATGTEHLSGYGSGSDEKQVENIEMWRSRSTDVGPGGPLMPADLSVRWQQYLDGIRDRVMPEDFEFNKLGLGSHLVT